MKQQNHHQLGSWWLRAPCQGRTSYDGPPWPCRRRNFEAACPALAASSGSASLPSTAPAAAACSLLLPLSHPDACCMLASLGAEGCGGGTAVAAWQVEMRGGDVWVSQRLTGR